MSVAVFKNYESFYNMVLSTAIMSNAQTEELESDAKKIIEFIGTAYKLSQEFIIECTTIILDKLSKLGRTTDQKAEYSGRRFGDVYSQEDSLLDIKGDVLAAIENIGAKPNFYVNSGWFDYSHYKTYEPHVRFAKIAIASASGNLISTRQIGILRALGIGCELDYERSIMRLTQCAFWGDIPSMRYLAYVNKLCGNTKKAELFEQIAEISDKYLLAGYTVIPEKDKQNYSAEALSYYVYISSIKQDVVYAHAKINIDFSFIEAITSDELDFFKRMNFINNYSKQEWKNVTNSSEAPGKKIGFK